MATIIINKIAMVVIIEVKPHNFINADVNYY